MRQPDDNLPLHPTARQPPLHFAGRKRELAGLSGMFEDVWRLGRPPGGLVLVDGVQGVGKTQLVRHFAGMVDDGASVLAMTTNDLDVHVEQLLARILGAAEAVKHGDFVRVDYYEERCRGMSHPQLMPALALAMQSVDAKQLSRNLAAQLLKTNGAEDPQAVLQSAMMRGVLTRSAVHDMSFGIPSFHEYMCAKAREIEAQRKREARLAAATRSGAE